MSKEKLKIPPVFECFAKFVSLDNSRVEIIPTHNYIAENGRVEFTFKIPNSYFGDQSKQIADLEEKVKLYEQSNKVLNDQLNKSTEHLSELNDKLALMEKALELAVADKCGLCVSCIICGESIELTMAEEMASRYGNIFKVCDECKKAVMKMRELTRQHEDKGE